jgi:hypothetical protein
MLEGINTVSTYVNIMMYLLVQLLYANKVKKIKKQIQTAIKFLISAYILMMNELSIIKDQQCN